jgi:hypothetical protein
MTNIAFKLSSKMLISVLPFKVQLKTETDFGQKEYSEDSHFGKAL